MSRFFLVPYTIRVKERATNQYVLLGNKTKLGFDLLDVIEHYLGNVIPSLPLDPKVNQVIRNEKAVRKDRAIEGIIRAGEYGYAASLLDVEADTISYERRFNDAELIPYYFLVKIPSTVDAGIIIFQRFGNSGIKDSFFRDFNNYFKKQLDEYMLEINPLVPKDMVKHYLQNRIVKIRLIKYGLPTDIADINSDAIPEGTEGESEFILKAKKNGEFPAVILDKLRGGIDQFLGSSDLPVGSILEIREFQADNIKVEVRVGNSYRIIDFSNSDRLKFSDDISAKVEIDLQTGHPKFDSIGVLSRKFLEDCAEAIWGENLASSLPKNNQLDELPERVEGETKIKHLAPGKD